MATWDVGQLLTTPSYVGQLLTIASYFSQLLANPGCVIDKEGDIDRGDKYNENSL